MSIIDDPNSDRRSLMYRAPCICNGEATGVQCKHFWSVIQRFPAANAESVRSGEKHRACTLMNGWPLEFTTQEKPSVCNRYEPRPAPGLVNIVRRAVSKIVGAPARAGYVPFDQSFELHNPMSPEEIDDLRKKYPDLPVDPTWQRGAHPATLTASDIVHGEQIGMLKPGEQIPQARTDNTDDVMNELHRDEGEGVLAGDLFSNSNGKGET